MSSPTHSAGKGPRVLVFEVTATGHHKSFVDHFLGELGRRQVEVSFILVLGRDFMGSIDSSLLSRAQKLNDLSITYLTESEWTRCTSDSVLRRAFHTTVIFERCLEENQADLGFAMYLDTLVPAMALRLPRRTSTSVSGILFRPSVHYREMGQSRASGAHGLNWIRERAKTARDSALYRLFLSNPRIERVLTMDPYFPDFAQSQFRGGHKVTPLAEPSPAATAMGNQKRKDDRTTMLIFGLIGRRKGVFETLDAVELLTSEEASNARLVIAGRLEDNVKDELTRRTDEIRASHPGIEIEIHDRFIPDAELADLVASSDVVLAPYQRHVGTAGVLAWAAHHGTPVITQSFGIIGEVVDRLNLGLTCDPSDPIEFSTCLRIAVAEAPEQLGDPSSLAQFADANTTTRFTAELLDAMSLPRRNEEH